MLVEKPISWKFELETPEIGDPEGVTTFSSEITPPAGEILFDGQAFTFAGPLSVKAEARWGDDDLHVLLKIVVKLISPCSRCLQPSCVEILDDFLYIFSLQGNNSSGEVPGGDDSKVVTVFKWRRFLDISDQVWERVILSLPIKVLCAPDCKGLCPQCGRPLKGGECGCTSEDIDPRLEILRAVTLDETNNSRKGGK